MIAFRPLTRDDYGLLAGWLVEPLVARWWNDDPSPAALEGTYGPCVDGTEPCAVFVVELDGAPVGIIQRYPIAAYPEDAVPLGRIVAVPDGALSIDYLLGEPAARGRGVGPAVIAAFVARTWHDVPAADDVLVPVAAGNRASWRALEKAGFTRVGAGALEPDNPVDPPDHVLYRVTRSVWSDRGAAGAPRCHPGPVSDEVVARYDAQGREVGAVARSRVYAEGLWHACAGVLLRSADGARVLVHRRVQGKAVFGGLHDCVAGGVLAPGETFAGAAARELAEELGVHDVELRPFGAIAHDDGRWRYHLVVFQAFSDGPLVLQPDEVAQAWWWTPDELRAHLADPSWPFVPDTRALLEHVDAGGGW